MAVMAGFLVLGAVLAVSSSEVRRRVKLAHRARVVRRRRRRSL